MSLINDMQVAEFLQAQGMAADHFHAGLPPETKKNVQQGFIRGDLRAIVATNAFGMGIDKPDVRLVIHANIPGSLENYLDNADQDFDPSTGADDFWDFGTSSQYPALKVDFDGDGVVTWHEFGSQGRPTPTPTPTRTHTPTPSPTSTPIPTSTPTPTATPIPTSTHRPTPSPTATPTPEPTPTPTVTPTPTDTPTPEPTATATPARPPTEAAT